MKCVYTGKDYLINGLDSRPHSQRLDKVILNVCKGNLSFQAGDDAGSEMEQKWYCFFMT